MFFFIAFGRAWHHLFGQPYLWMEQASVYYKYGFEHGFWEAVFAPHQGYVNVWINVVTAVAAKWLPMEYAPYAMTVGGTLVGVVLAALVFAPGSPFPNFFTKLLAMVLMVFVPPAEDRFSMTYTHFYMAAAAALILVSEARAATERAWQRWALVFAVLCGPVVLFVLPVYVLAFFQKPARERLVQAAILACGIPLQLYALHVSGGEALGGLRFHGFDEVGAFVFWLYDRLIVYPFSNWQVFFRTGEFFMQLLREGGLWCWLALMFALLGLAGWVGVARGRRNTWVTQHLLLAILCISLGNFFCAVAGDKMTLITQHHRYFISQATLVAFVFVYNLAHARGWWHRGLYGVLVCWLLVGGVQIWRGYSAAAASPLPWAYEVERWKRDNGYSIRIMPPGQTMRLR
ncbi:MAG: hypothetical protein K2Q01_01735 [Rickettsiales bacterium]|nr:hypothetical protein [Rickettsiales bacterium]